MPTRLVVDPYDGNMGNSLSWWKIVLLLTVVIIIIAGITFLVPDIFYNATTGGRTWTEMIIMIPVFGVLTILGEWFFEWLRNSRKGEY